MTSEKSTYNIKDGYVLDIEVFPNWAYVLFQEPNGTFRPFEFKENDPAPKNDLARYIAGKNLVSFNGNNYDDYILQHLISSTSTPASTYKLSKQLIESDKYSKPATLKSIDLMGSTGQVSLKLLAVRMGWPKLEELPFDPTKPVDATAISHLKDYCKNDVLITAELYKRMAGALGNRQCLSEKYGVDLLSATEPNIAETVITSEYEKQTGLNKYALKKLAKKPTTVTLTCPEWFDSITHPALKGFVDKVKSVVVPVKDSGHADTRELNGVISIGDRSYKVGGGGIHSIDGPGCYRSNDKESIVEIDVTSYYPAIIIQNNLWVRHTRPEIISEIYAGIVNARIAAKRAGDKLTADSYKIVINSYFGKHSNIHSALYDPAVGASVTVIGQIGLLWLILNLEAAGYRILSGNTDGIVVKIPTAERDKVEAIVSEWEQATGFDMEYTDYSAYARKDVNNYISITTDGTIKAKGTAFLQGGGLRHNPSAPIIARAVAAKLKDGTAIGKTIKTETDINSFIRCAKRTRVVIAGKPVKIVRWYHSTNKSEPLKSIFEDGREIAIGNTTNIAAVLDLPYSIPADLDYDYYIKEAKDLHYSISRPLNTGMNITAAKLRADGFPMLAPRNEDKKIPLGHTKARKYDNSADYNIGSGLAARTGPDTKMFCLDLDYIEKLPSKLKKITEKHPTKASWCDANGTTGEDVLAGNARGKLFYQVNGHIIPASTRPKILRESGVEILYGASKPAQIVGYRSDVNAWYQLSDAPIAQLPDELYDYMIDEGEFYTGAAIRKAKLDHAQGEEGTAEESEPATDEDLVKLQRFVRGISELNHMRWDSTRKHIGFFGFCIGEHDRAHKDNLMISVRDGKPWVYCFHADCPEAPLLQIRLYELWTAKIDIDHNLIAEMNIPNIETRPLVQKYLSDESVNLIKSATGAGKTYECAAVALLLGQHDENNLVIIANHSVAAINNLVQELLKISKAKNLEEIGVQIIRSPEKNDKLDPAARIVLTTHQRFCRKGASQQWHRLAQDLIDVSDQRKIHIFIDECDQFFEGLVRVIPLDSMMRMDMMRDLNPNGDKSGVLTRLNSCPGRSNKSDCNDCQIELGTVCGTIHGGNSHHGFTTPRYKDEGKYQQFKLPPITTGPFEGFNTYKYAEVTGTHDGYLDSIDYKFSLDGKAHNSKDILVELLNCSIATAVTSTAPMFDGEQANQKDLIVRDIKPDVYPNQPCEVRRFIMADGSPLALLKKVAYKIRFISGTVLPVHTDMAKRVLGDDIALHDIDTNTKKIDETLLIVVDSRLKLTGHKFADEVNASDLKYLIFVATKRGAKTIFEHHNFDDICLYDGTYSHDPDRAESGLEQVLLSYVRSAIARGENFPKHDVVVADMQCFDPRDGMLISRINAFTVGERLIENRDTRIKQTTGRIMRLREGDGLQRRVVVLHNVTDADKNSIEGITANLQSRTVQPVQVVRYSGQSMVVDACCEFVDNGKVTAEELGQIKKATKGQKTTLRHLKKLRANGMNWRESARRCSPERHFTSKKLLGIIKGVFEDNRRMTLKNINEVISGE